MQLSVFKMALIALISLWLSVLSIGQGESRLAPGELILGPSPESRADSMDAQLQQLGLRVVKRDAITGVYRLAVTEGQEQAWIARLRNLDGVAYVERNSIGGVASSFLPDDTYFAQQWHLENTGQVPGTVGADINIRRVWDVTRGSSSIGVAILDTGLDLDHPEFAGRIDPDGQDFVNGDLDPEATHPHGTWVAGCIAANGDNTFGVTGVDHQCRILPLQVIGSTGSGTAFDLAQGLNYAAAQADIQIICMSLQNYLADTVLLNALANASQAGKILVTCASNLGAGAADLTYPAASPLTITVGNTTAFDQLNSTSGTGNAVDFVAPGTSIVTAQHGSQTDSFDVVTGCSFATPLVSGLISLILARCEQLGLPAPNQDAVYEYLRLGAVDQVGIVAVDTPGYDTSFGHGRIDAAATFDNIDLLGDCAAGNIDLAFGGPLDIFRVNGSSGTGTQRHVVVGIQQPFTFELDVPLSNPLGQGANADFIVWGAFGEPGTHATFELPFGIGTFCFPPSDLSALPDLFTLANSFGGGQPAVLPALAAPWVASTAGLPFPAVATLQGIIIDSPQFHVGRTNAIVLEVRLLEAPVISSVETPTGIAGSALTIQGTGFQTGVVATRNGVPLGLTSVSSTVLIFSEPAGFACDELIELTNVDGQMATVVFAPSPSIDSIATPDGTSVSGGKVISISGQNFGGNAVVMVGGNSAIIVAQSDSLVVALSPPGSVGTTTLLLATDYGCAASTPYTYTP